MHKVLETGHNKEKDLLYRKVKHLKLQLKEYN